MARPRAASVCNEPGCPLDQPCPEHARQPWANAEQRRPNAKRGRQLQADNARILKRHQGICHVCGGPGATQVDHVTPLAEGGADTDANKRPIHPTPCHADKSAAEAARARQTA